MKKHKILCTFVIAALSVTLLLGAAVTYAYFSSIGWVVTGNGDKQIAQIGMNISLLFDRLDPEKVDAGTKLKIGASTYDSGADWGTEQNPYIISDIRHLQNLSVLQEIGYFNELYIKNNYTNDTYNGGTSIPYFLVCNPDGTPVTIDGSKITFAPIGTDEFPFIGYVGGAFTDGTTTTNGKDSAVSVLENIHVVTTDDVTDVGLFSVISYLGSESTAVDGVFSGVVSTVRDLVLSDVTVTVEEPSWIQAVVDHLFSFSALSETDIDQVPHENHHIGILAGHVEYANVQYISVYYSDDQQIAIDLRHTNSSENGENANYLSISGILGFVYNMNPEVTDAGISVGSGINNGDLDVSSGGAGTGGGLSSGTGRGYVTAEGVYNLYSYIAANRLGDQLCYDFYLEGDETATKYTGIMLLKTGDKYYLEDGVTEVTITNGEASFGNIVTNSFFVAIDDGSGGITYMDKTETTIVRRFNTTPLRLMDAKDSEGNPLCTEYIRNRLLWGTEATGLYYFYDGVFTFALSGKNANDSIEDTWDNGKADSFTIGTNDNAMWEANTSQGNATIVAFLSDITNNDELDAAIAAGKKLVILLERGDTNYLLTVSTASDADTGNGDHSLRVQATALPYVDAATKESIKNGYDSGAIDSTGMESILANWDNITLLYEGTTTETTNINDLRNIYDIKAQESDQYDYAFGDGQFEGSASIIAIDSEKVIESRDERAEFDGFFYCIRTTTKYNWANYPIERTYTYYYMNSDGTYTEELTTTTVSRSSPLSSWSEYVVALTEDTMKNDIQLYKYEDASGNKYTGPLVYSHNNEYYQEYDCYDNNYDPVTVDGGHLTVGSVVQYTYDSFITQIGSKYYLNSVSGDRTTEVQDVTVTSDVSNGRPLYSYKVLNSEKSGKAVLITCTITDFYLLSDALGKSESETNFLRLLYRNYRLGYTYYSLMSSTDIDVKDGSTFKVTILGIPVTPSVQNSRQATIAFKGDGTCNISFTVNGTTRYIGYNSSFGFVSDNGTADLKIYAIEGTLDTAFGRITFDPVAGDTNRQTFQADEYVLYATQEYSGSNGRTDGYAVYDVVSLEELRAKDSGWKNSLGENLTSKDLHKKFAMAEGASFGATLTILNGNFSIGDGTIVAPIGTLGVEANIPTGTIAFRVNTTTEQGAKIRVIVAVPQTPYYKGETGFDLSSEPYYFGLWQSEANGANILSSFTADSAIAKFEIPRSNTYQPGTSPGGTDSNYVLANYGGEQRRCYLNGNMVLVAYTFTVYNEGVYLLGSTNGPMEIVYFSADGTASAGRDGSSGSHLGNIDFVYDHNGKIIPVTDAAEDGGTEDFDFYYASLCILYTDNGYGGVGNYPDVNDLQIHIRRTATDGVGTQITYQVNSTLDINAVLAQVARYSISADTVERSPDGTR